MLHDKKMPSLVDKQIAEAVAEEPKKKEKKIKTPSKKAKVVGGKKKK